MGWFDEQGLPGGSIAPIESGYQPGGGGWGGGRVFTDDERERMRQELMTRTGGQWGGEAGGGAKIPTMDFRTGGEPIPGDRDLTDGGQWNPIGAPGDPGNRDYLWNRPELWTSPWTGTRPDGGQGPITAEERRALGGQTPIAPGDMHNPGWGIERPALPTPDQGGSYPLPTQDFRRGGDPVPAPGPAYMPPPQGGTLGAVGMAQPMAPRDPRTSGGFGSYGGFGGYQAGTSALQSASGYGGGRQLGGFAGGGGSMLRSPTGVSRQVARSDVPFYLQRGATEVR